MHAARFARTLVALAIVLAACAATAMALGSAAPGATSTPAARAAAAACSIPPVVLLEAHASKGRVAVSGLARAQDAGKKLSIEARADGKRVGRAVSVAVAPDGRFSASLKLPKGSLRPRVRYRAALGTQLSRTLKLQRKMHITSRRPAAGGTRVSGRIDGPRGRWTLTIMRQRCTSTDKLKTIRTTRKGAFSVLLPAPAATDPVTLFRARAKLGRKRTFSEIILATVPPPQHAPLANDDPASGEEDHPFAIAPATLLANDSDPDGDALTLAAVAPTADTHGTATLAGGNANYAPAPDFNGTASFEYTVSDGHGHTAKARVVVTVAGVQDPPTAADDEASTNEGTPVAVPVAALLADDHDPDGDPLTVSSVGTSAATHGTATLAGDAVTYTPDAHFTGDASFEYAISDGHGNAARAQVRVVVHPVQDPPVARDDTAETMVGTALRLPLAELLLNDSDDDGDALAVTSVGPTPSTHGTVALAGASATYAPEPGFTGDAAFVYTISDGHGNTAAAQVAVSVRPAQAPPATSCTRPPTVLVGWWRAEGDASDRITAVDGQLLHGAGFAPGIAGQAFAFDGDDDLFAVSGAPALARDAPLTIELWFQPFNGLLHTGAGSHDLFAKGSADAIGWVSAGAPADPPLARIEVRGPVPAPASAPMSLVAGRWHHVAVALDGSGYRLYVDGELAGTSASTHSILASAADIALGGGFRGAIDELSIYDRALSGAEVRAVYDAAGGGKCLGVEPVAQDDTRETPEDSVLQIPASALLANDSDADGDTLTVTSVSGGPSTRGTVSLAGGQVTYTPAPDFNGSASFDYAISDGLGHNATASVALTVREVNDPPHATADAKTSTGRVLTFPAGDLLANDSPGPADESAQSLAVTQLTPSTATHGDVSLALGTIVYTADAGYNGPATFGYEVCDDGTTAGSADPRCDTSTVTVAVTQTPVTPVADDVTATTDEDASKAITLSATAPSGGSLTYTVVSSPSHGDVVPSTPGAAGRTYVPDADFNGSDSFTYRANDGAADSNVATVHVTVREVNDPPVTAPDSLHAVRDHALTFSASQLLANDSPGPANESAQTLVVTSVDAGSDAHGTATLTSGEVTYTPDAGFAGDATLTYHACDDGRTAGASDPRCATETATVSVGDATLTQLAVTPDGRSIASGETLQYHATGTFSDGSSRDVSDEVTWTSSAPAVANVTPAGQARADDAGSTTITARQGSVEAHASLTVTAPDLRSIVVEPASPAMLAGDTQAFHATGVLSDGTSESLDGDVTWATSDPGVATIDASTGVATGAGEGSATITASQGTVAGTAAIAVSIPIATDTTAPTADIAAPVDDADITSPTEVTGTASDPNMLRYVLEIAPAGETTFTTIRESTNPVTDGVLGELDPTMLLNELYTVRLTVYDRGGNTATDSATYQVDRDQKVGNFSLAFQDLNVPLAGIPITIERVYDSRDKGKGDFGVGWRMNIQTLHVKTSGVQGDGWTVTRTGTFLPVYTLVPTRAHTVSVTLPGGKVEQFDLAPSPSVSGIVPFEFVTATYRPRPGTAGSLQAVDNTDLIVVGGQPGEVTLVDDTDIDTFDPQTFEYTALNGTKYVIDKTGVQRVSDPNGNTLTFGHDGITHSSGTNVTFTRDAQDRITEITDPNGHTIHYAYNANGDLSSQTDASANRTTFKYNRSHGLIEIRDPRGYQAARYEYDDDGRLTAIIDAAGRRTTFDHDIDGRQDVIRDREGHATVFDYDERGDVLRKTDPLGRTTTWTYDAQGNQLSKTDPRGKTTAFEYDALSHRTKTTDPLGNATQATYDAGGNVTAHTDGTGRTTTYEYDPYGELTRAVRPDGTTDLTMAYDGSGNVVSVDRGAGDVQTFGYDSSGRRTSSSDATGRSVTTSYDSAGNLVEQTDASGGHSSFTYDASNLLTSMTDAVGATTRFEWDATGNLVKRTGPAPGDVRRWEYDTLARVTAEIDQLGHRRTYEYDADGRLLSSTDRNGVATHFHYDAAGNLVGKDAPGSADDATYAYDSRGSLDRAANADTVMAFEHDDAGRLTKTTTSGALGVDLPTTVLTFAYDGAGRRTAMTGPWGSTAYAYDAAARLASVTDPAGGTFSWTRDAAGRPVTLTRPNGVVTTTGYDLAGQVVDQQDALGASVLGSTHLDRNAAGSATSITDVTGTHDYAYDAAGRLTAADNPAAQPDEAYAYDAAGRRTSSGETYDAASRLLADDTYTYTYDDEGNLLSRTARAGGAVTRYAWDADGRLRKVTTAQGETTYRYDALGRRVAASGPSGARSYAFSDAPNPVAEYAAGPDPVAVNTFAPGLDMPLSSKRGADSSYPLQDPRQNVTAVTDAAGAVEERYVYGSFGQRVDVPSGTGNELTFAAREYDPDASAYYMRARWYDPENGRFLSEDPAPASSAYAYVQGNPIASTDPTGLTNLTELSATQVLADDIESAEAAYAGTVYQFMRTVKAGLEIGQKLYTGMSEAISTRLAAHRAAGYVASEIEELEVMVTSRYQLRALEQVRLLAARMRGEEVANAINAMSRHNWEKVGAELVERWFVRNAAGASESLAGLLEDIDLVLAEAVDLLPFL